MLTYTKRWKAMYSTIFVLTTRVDVVHKCLINAQPYAESRSPHGRRRDASDARATYFGAPLHWFDDLHHLKRQCLHIQRPTLDVFDWEYATADIPYHH